MTKKKGIEQEFFEAMKIEPKYQDRRKFRVWDVAQKKYCDLTRTDVLFFIAPDGRLCRCIVYNVDGEISYFMTYPEEKYFKVEFCIGLKDKNGTLIYEGDIIKFKYSLERTGYEKTKNTFEIKIGYVSLNKFNHSVVICDELEWHIDNAIRGEIIGRIYENPQLLEAE